MRLHEFIDPVACFYHGSTKSGLTVLKRQPSKLADGEVVFAATMPEIAIAMSGHWSDDDFDFGHRTDNKRQEIEYAPYVMREKKPGNFEKFFNQTIYLYEVPASYFEPDDNLQDFEVLSHDDVPVHAWIEFDDPLSYMEASPVLKLVRA